jgi:hypothetical protein
MDNKPHSFTTLGRQALMVLENLITQREVNREKRDTHRDNERRDKQPAEQDSEKIDRDLCHVAP